MNLIFIIGLLATYRLTLLVTADELTAGPRDWLTGTLEARAERRGRDESKLAYLLSCPWCASVWISFPVAWSGWQYGHEPWWFIPAWALTASAVTGILATFAAPGE